MKDMLQDKETVADTNSYVLGMLLKSDMAKAFPILAREIAFTCTRSKNSIGNQKQV